MRPDYWMSPCPVRAHGLWPKPSIPTSGLRDSAGYVRISLQAGDYRPGGALFARRADPGRFCSRVAGRGEAGDPRIDERRIAELRIKALRDTIDQQAIQIDQLSKQLNAVLQQAQDLAVKALEGASTSGSYQAIREIALEQAKTLQKTAGR
jgi:hypothetical protein